MRIRSSFTQSILLFISCVEIDVFHRILRFRGILRHFFSYLENNAFLAFLHLQEITAHFLLFFVCVEFFKGKLLSFPPPPFCCFLFPPPPHTHTHTSDPFG